MSFISILIFIFGRQSNVVSPGRVAAMTSVDRNSNSVRTETIVDQRSSCFNLKTGSLIVLWLSLISSVYTASFKIPNLSMIVPDTALTWKIAYHAYFVTCGPFSSILGLYGIHKKNPSLLLFYEIFRGFHMLLFWIVIPNLIFMYPWFIVSFLSVPSPILNMIMHALIVLLKLLLLDPHHAPILFAADVIRKYHLSLSPFTAFLGLFAAMLIIYTPWCCVSVVRSYHVRLQTDILRPKSLKKHRAEISFIV